MELSSQPSGDRERSRKGWTGIVGRGFAMGAADVVPGVSGGTMALVLGIYEELINAVRSLIHPETVRLLLRFQLRDAAERVPWRFLLSLGAGMALAVITLAQVLEYCLERHPILLWAFFFGLVAASIVTVSRHVGCWSLKNGIAGVVGALFAWLFVGLVPVQTPDATWFLFISGALAACAMLLPGISGSFVLVLLGKYQFILGAVNERNLTVVVTVAAGVASGACCFVHLLGWVLRRFHDVTIAALIGLMLGSLRKIWPWKETLRTIVDRHGKDVPIEQVNILPNTQLLPALILMLVGFGTVMILNTVAVAKDETT